MFVVSMLSWWYGQGFAWILGRIGPELKSINNIFATDVLLKTWFSPWKQITTVPTSYTFFQKLIDNTISRLIGFLVRTFMLLVAGIWAVTVLIFGLVSIILWPFIPLLIFALPVLFVMGVEV